MSMDALLTKATTKDDNPVPGYVFVELSKITHNDIIACEKMADWLAEKLKKPEASIKWKVLCVMKNVSRAGRSEFKRALQRHTDAVKACLAFKAPLDPLKGDEAGRRVRETAKEALEAIFDNSTMSSSASSAVSSRITSYSADAHSAYPPADKPSAFPPAGSHKPIFGGGGVLDAPPITTGTMSSMSSYDPRSDKGSSSSSGLLGSIADKVKSAFVAPPPPTAGLSSPASDYNFASNRPGLGGPVYTGPPQSSSFPPVSPLHSSHSAFPPVDPSQHRRVPGAPGGDWGSSPSKPISHSGYGTGSGSSYGNGSSTVGSGVVPVGRVGGASKDGAYERGIIEELTAPGGVRPVPDKDKLQSFLGAVRTLDTALVATLFDERLSLALPSNDTAGTGANIALKTIAVIEAISTTPGLETVKKYLSDHCDMLLELVESADKPAIKSAASKVLHTLGVEHDGGAPSTATNTSGRSGAGELDLLGLSTPPVAGSNAPVTGATDLLSGLSISAPVTSTGPLFHGLSPAPAPAPAPKPAMDLFGGLSVGASTVTPAPPSAMLAGLHSAPAPAPTPAAPVAPSSLLAGLNAGSGMYGGAAAPSQTAQLQQQLLMVQQQINNITMQLASPAGASMQTMLFPQLMALQQQQQQLMAALTASMSMGSAPMMPRPAQPTLAQPHMTPLSTAATASSMQPPVAAAPKPVDVFDFIGGEFK